MEPVKRKRGDDGEDGDDGEQEENVNLILPVPWAHISGVGTTENYGSYACLSDTIVFGQLERNANAQITFSDDRIRHAPMHALRSVTACKLAAVLSPPDPLPTPFCGATAHDTASSHALMMAR